MKLFPGLLFLVGALAAASLAHGQNDPGPGRGPSRAGMPLQGLDAWQIAYFQEGLARFREVDSVTGTEPGAGGKGLGPRFNMNSCAGCHAAPEIGGSSPGQNPQIPVATRFGAMNRIPAFLQPNGPVRVARFVRRPDGTPDGGVHDLFVVSGRSDAVGCNIAQPDFAAAAQQNNLSLRIPTPLFGAGLLEAIPDAALLDNLNANPQLKQQLGIRGHLNHSGNDGTVTRFGWKAQNKSLLLFAGEAYNVEQGVTNELFPNERDTTPGCVFNGGPEDRTDFTGTNPAEAFSDLNMFAFFMKMLAPAQPAPPNPSISRGRQAFSDAGCAACHTPSLTTGLSAIAALSQKQVALFSDLALHNMGQGLADGVNQGEAQGGDWRTAPLWGLGQRAFFLHDGRAQDLVQAIHLHSSPGSEGSQSVSNFDALPPPVKQDLINFLRSL